MAFLRRQALACHPGKLRASPPATPSTAGTATLELSICRLAAALGLEPIPLDAQLLEHALTVAGEGAGPLERALPGDPPWRARGAERREAAAVAMVAAREEEKEECHGGKQQMERAAMRRGTTE